MSSPRQRVEELRQELDAEDIRAGLEVPESRPELDIPWSHRTFMPLIFNVAAPVLFHPRVDFESGKASHGMWREQLKSDAPTMVIMSHPHEVDAVMMAPIAQGGLLPPVTSRTRALRPMRYDTLVTAKRTLRELPHAWGLAGWIVRNGGTLPVDRPYESEGETEEEKQDRQEGNELNQNRGINILRAGGNLVYFIEGGTARRVKQPDDTYKKIDREKDEMLPAQSGFARVINGTPPDVRERLRIMTVVTRYDETLVSPLIPAKYRRIARLMFPTVAVLDPVKPVEGDVEAVRQQGEALMRRGFDRVQELDRRRRELRAL